MDIFEKGAKHLPRFGEFPFLVLVLFLFLFSRVPFLFLFPFSRVPFLCHVRIFLFRDLAFLVFRAFLSFQELLVEGGLVFSPLVSWLALEEVGGFVGQLDLARTA